ncbi:MAG: M23 family metallopeptidase [Patescibacteria group bacterium]
MRYFVKEFVNFFDFLGYYSKRKLFLFSRTFETGKNRIVKLVSMKRGRYNRPFLHLTGMGILGIGVSIAPFLAETYPLFNNKSSGLAFGSAQTKQSIIVGDDVFQTEISKKPRDKILTYTVEKGDTIDTVAKKFGISTDTIRWANDLADDSLSIGDELQILPVTGIAHKVAEGDTVHTIAKEYETNPQGIVDFPFNDFANAETFALVTGQMLIVPDGVEQSTTGTIYTPPRRTYIAAQGSGVVSSSGFAWPLQGGTIGQYPSWYHQAVDILAPMGVPVYAGQSGRISNINIGTWNYGYGTDVYITDGSGTETHYAHLASVAVSVGDSVVAGKTPIGINGMTGRTTGPHVHFEVRRNGSLVDPLPYLQ